MVILVPEPDAVLSIDATTIGKKIVGIIYENVWVYLEDY